MLLKRRSAGDQGMTATGAAPRGHAFLTPRPACGMATGTEASAVAGPMPATRLDGSVPRVGPGRSLVFGLAWSPARRSGKFRTRTVAAVRSSRGARSVGRHGCTAAKDVPKPVKEIAAGLGCRLRDMTEPEEAVDQPAVLYVLHLDTNIA
jgi:hypothetical protein